MKDFRDLIVWQKAMDLFENVVKDVEKFPQNAKGDRLLFCVINKKSSLSPFAFLLRLFLLCLCTFVAIKGCRRR